MHAVPRLSTQQHITYITSTLSQSSFYWTYSGMCWQPTVVTPGSWLFSLRFHPEMPTTFAELGRTIYHCIITLTSEKNRPSGHFRVESGHTPHF